MTATRRGTVQADEVRAESSQTTAGRVRVRKVTLGSASPPPVSRSEVAWQLQMSLWELTEGGFERNKTEGREPIT